MTTPDATVTQESLAEQLQARHGETVFLSSGGRAAAIDWTSLRIDDETDDLITATASSVPGEGEEAVELTLTVDADGQVTLLDEVEEAEEADTSEDPADGDAEEVADDAAGEVGEEPGDGPTAEDTDESTADGADDEPADAEPEDEDSGSAAEAEEPAAELRPQRPAGPAPQQAAQSQPQAPQPQAPQPQVPQPQAPQPHAPQQVPAPTTPEQFGAGQFDTEQSGAEQFGAEQSAAEQSGTEQPAGRPPGQPPGQPAGQPAGQPTEQQPKTLPDYTPDQLTAAYGNRWFPFEGQYFVIDWQTWDVDNRLPDAIGSYVDARDPEDARHRLYVWLNLITGPEIVQATPAEPEAEETADEEPSADDLVDQYQSYAFSFEGNDFVIDWSTWDPDQRTDDGWLGSSMDAVDRDDNNHTVYVWFHRTTTPMIVAAEAEAKEAEDAEDPAAQARSRFDDEICQQLHDRWSADGKVFTDAAGRAYDVSAWVDGGYDGSFEFAGFDESALYATLAALTADEPSRPVLLHLRITDPDSILVEREESR